MLSHLLEDFISEPHSLMSKSNMSDSEDMSDEQVIKICSIHKINSQ